MFFYTVVLYPIHLFLELVYAVSYRLLARDGLAIICMSLAVNLVLLPIYNVADSLRDKVLAKQKAMERGIAHIKKSFSGDERFLMLSEYYAQNRYSPLSGLLSSLSILLQFPFFFVAYQYLSNLQTLNDEGFLFVKNLGRCDALIVLPHFTLNILPIVMTLVNCISGAIYTKGRGVREKLQVYLLAALFLVLLYRSPSGLVFYWTYNNIFSLLKNLWARWRQKKAGRPEAGRGRLSRWLLSVLSALKLDGTERSSVFFFSCLVLCLLNGIALPTALLSSSTVEFSAIMNYANPLRSAAVCFMQALGLFVFWPACIYFFFKGNGKVQKEMAFIAAVLALASLANAYAFPGNYGDVSPSLEFLNVVDFRSVSLFSLVNVLVLLAIAAGLLFLFRTGRAALYTGLSKVLLVALAAFSLVSMLKVRSEYTAYRAHVEQVKVDAVRPVFELSRNHPNVVLIMLDRAQPQYVEEIFKELPALRDAFSGFTLYDNAVSFNAHTLAGLPPLFGGYEYTPVEMNRRGGETLAEKNNQSQLLLARILHEQLGFSSVIADPQYGNYSLYCDTSFIEPYAPSIRSCQTKEVYSELWYKEKNTGGLSDPRTNMLDRNLLFFSFFRAFPVCMRAAVYKNGSYWTTAPYRDMKEFIDSYSVLDYLKELTSISETDGGRYMSLVNEITHCSEFLQAPDYIPVDNVTDWGTSLFNDWDAYPPQVAAFRMLAAWFDYLRSEGVYENTRIVIASDHGCREEELAIEEDPALDRRITGGDYHGRGHYHPLLMFKDFGDGTPFVNDRETFMTNADAPSLLLGGLVEHPVNPFTGKEIPLDTRPLKEDGVIISASDAHRPVDNGSYRYTIRDNEWWLVRDSIFKASSWTQLEPPEGTK